MPRPAARIRAICPPRCWLISVPVMSFVGHSERRDRPRRKLRAGRCQGEGGAGNWAHGHHLRWRDRGAEKCW